MSAAKRKFKEDSKTKLLEGGPVLNSNRFYLQVKGYGQCDVNGKTVMGVGLSNPKIVAEPDQPLAIIESLIEEVAPMFRYSSAKAMQKDIDALRAYVGSLKVVERKPTKKVKK